MAPPPLMYYLVNATTGEFEWGHDRLIYVAEQWERKDKPQNQIHVYDGTICVLVLHESLVPRFLGPLLLER
jgi:hypothetical protein